MRLKLIACEVFTREICYCVARSPHTIDIEFTKLRSHDQPESLRKTIQTSIDEAVDSGKYDAILLGFGLCGNSTINLQAKEIPVIIPRAHDCCTIFLGSKSKFKDHFGDKPSSGFTSIGYFERGGESFVHDLSDATELMAFGKSYDEYVKEYGDECAQYLRDTLNAAYKKPQENTITYIKIPETHQSAFILKCKQYAKAESKEFIQLPGCIALIEKLTFGDWNEHDFLTVKPGYCITGVYDMDEIMKADKL